MSGVSQVFALVVAIPSFWFIVSMVRRGNLRMKYGLVWLPVALALLVFAVAPGLLNWIAETVRVSYPPTVLFVLAIAFLLFVTVHHSWELSRADERIRSLAERIAIENIVAPTASPEPGALPDGTETRGGGDSS